jgi:CRISPR-associated exonuclease Cas4
VGGGRETPGGGTEESGEIEYIVWPSELHRLGYCPRLLFFEAHLPRRRSFLERLRLLAGKIYHAILSIPLRLRGFKVEEPLEARFGNVLLRGRSDALLIADRVAYVIERKSGRAPRRGAWPSDLMQAAAYGLIAIKRDMAENAILDIRYRDGGYSYLLDRITAAAVLQAIDDVVKIKYWGIVGYPRRSRGRCSKCPYRDVCRELDEQLKPPDNGEIYEPGSWIEEERLSPPEASREDPGADKDGVEEQAERSYRREGNRNIR